ncbi:AAA family ATPase [Nonomuraea jiangxiensis]|uniref:AAA domain-containing protein n=1 Tax=Nonomuraea jiangxiensis TaxID=633440 RepID=A0A1G8NI39_9ACTN|nr:ATP-binding protein [Nonomuraea jiangxiensis]SDI79853.1 AAA domain-containing protein [Nonomuraea jiangxiensis]
MYISKLVIQRVRGFSGPREVALGFDRPDGSYAGWTVLAGRNGSGKTTILQAIALGIVGDYFIRDWDVWSGRQKGEQARIGVTVIQDSEFDGGLDFGEQVFELRWDDEGHPYVPQRSTGSHGRRQGVKALRFGPGEGWFFAGYGPFRRLSPAAFGHGESSRSAMYAGLRTLFDQDVSLVEGVGWLIEQHLYRLEGRAGAAELLDVVLSLLTDGMLPDGHTVVRVDSDGLWLRRDNGAETPLRQMSEGYRTVTAVVVDIIRQMHLAYGSLRVTYQGDTPTLAYPGVILIDEIENHLHVGWQKRIGEWLTSHFPLVQFIVTTHSPYVCQTADPNGLIALPGPNEPKSAHVVDQNLYERVVFGSGDDAILTELFGVDSPYSTRAEDIRRHLGDLEDKVLNGSASEAEIEEYRELSKMLESSLSARVDEVSSRLGRQD